MKNSRINFSIKAVLVLLCLCIALSSFVACKSKKENSSSSSQSSSSQVDETSSETPSETADDTPSEEDTVSVDETPPIDEEYIAPVNVKNAGSPININFMGVGSAIYQLFTYIPDQYGRNATEKQAQEQFDRMQNIGINYVRSYYNSWMAYDANTKTFNYDNANMQGFYKECKELGKRGINIAITTGWSLHALTDNSSSIPSPEIYVAGNFDQTVKNHTQWMIDSLKQMRAHGVTNVKDLILFTEPGKVSYEEDKMYGEFEAWLKLVKSLHEGLVKEGMRQDYRFVGPNQANDGVHGPNQNIEDNASFLRFALEKADEYVDIYTSHNYPRANPTDDVFFDQVDNLWNNKFMKAMRDYQSKKPFWIDEWNVQLAGGITLNANSPWRGTQQAVIVSATMNFGISNTIMWSLFDQQWPNNVSSGGEFLDGVQICGLAPSLQISTIPTMQYYGYTILSKYIRTKGHGKVYLTNAQYGDGIYSAYCENEDGEKTLLVVNTGWQSAKFEVSFDKSIGGVTMYRHVYDPTTIKPDTRGSVIGTDRAYKSVKSKLVDNLPTGAIAVYTTIKG